VKIIKNERDPPLSTGKLLILSSVSQNVLKFYQQLTGEERRIPFIFDDFHFCRFRVIGLDMKENRIIGLDMKENRIFTLCRMIT
jgi:hypothetical protein